MESWTCKATSQKSDLKKIYIYLTLESYWTEPLLCLHMESPPTPPHHSSEWSTCQMNGENFICIFTGDETNGFCFIRERQSQDQLLCYECVTQTRVGNVKHPRELARETWCRALCLNCKQVHVCLLNKIFSNNFSRLTNLALFCSVRPLLLADCGVVNSA